MNQEPLPHDTTQKPTTDPSEAAMCFWDGWRVFILRCLIIGLTLWLALAAGGVYTYLAPRLYYSRVTLQIHMRVKGG